MKLLKVSTVPITLEAFFRPFGEHFRERGWVVDAAADKLTSNDLCIKAFRRCIDLPFSRNPFANNIPSVCRRIRSVVSDTKYNVVHVHTPNAAFLVRLALRNRPRLQPAIVYTAHGFHYNPRRRHTIAYWWLEKFAASWTDRLIVVNQDDFDLARNGRLIDPNKLELIPSAIGIDLQRYNRNLYPTETREMIRRELNIPSDATIFLKLAEFIPRKRHVDALNALAMLKERNAFLLLAGSGPLEPMIQELAIKLGIQQQVRFLGFRRDVSELLIASDYTILLSEREGLPRSLMESMALETPIIGTNVKGTKELVENAGFMVPFASPADVSAVMRKVMQNPALGAAKAREARLRIKEYSLDAILLRHEQIYTQLMNSR